VVIERFRVCGIRRVAAAYPAITFTEKATNQMRERLAGAFADRPDLLLQVQRAGLDSTRFCTRLLRENAILASGSAFRVLNEQEAFALERKSVDDALDVFLGRVPSRCANCCGRCTRGSGNSILDVYHVMSLWAGWPRRRGRACSTCPGESLASGRVEQLDPTGHPLSDNVTGSCPAIFAVERQPADQLAQVATGVHDCSNAADSPRRRSTSRSSPSSTASEPDPKEQPDLRSDQAAQRRGDPGGGAASSHRVHASHRATLVEAIDRFDALYRAARLRKARWTSRIWRVFRSASSNRTKKLGPIRRHFDHVLMDEFQDTNGLQSRLLDLLRPADRFYAVGDINIIYDSGTRSASVRRISNAC